MPSLSPEPNRSSPLSSFKGDHAGLCVANLEAALTWYKEKLDFRLTGTTSYGTITYAFIAPVADESFQIELVAGPGAVEKPPHRDLNESQGLLGWHHICLRVDSVDDTVNELKRRDVTVIGEPMDANDIARRIAFFQDPWGNVFELTQPLSD